MGKSELPKNKDTHNCEMFIPALVATALIAITLFVIERPEAIIFPELTTELPKEIQSSGSVPSISIDYSDINKK